MTRMLVRAADAHDAAIAASCGCDVVEIALDSAADLAKGQAIRSAFPGRLRLRLAHAFKEDLLLALAIGVDEIALPADAIRNAAADLETIVSGPKPIAMVAVVQADRDMFAPLGLLAGHVEALLLEAPEGTRLIDVVAIARLDAFAHACRGVGIPCGFAGGLEAPDVVRLLLLQPDLLAFDLALRHDHGAGHELDSKAVDTMRALIPHDDALRHPGAILDSDETDHIFVHDFVALLSIGAYQAERGMRQRVRFSVDADVRRPAEPPTDMRGVFSYDIIIETIRVLASRAHVTFVETLAEELATRLLAYPQLSVVTVKVEKLDVIEGAVGIVIRRDRTTAARLQGQG